MTPDPANSGCNEPSPPKRCELPGNPRRVRRREGASRPSSPPPAAPAGGEIPDFHLLRPIGAGGFGQVWLAANQTTGRLQAVKLVPLAQAHAGKAAGRELTSLTRLEANLRREHPNLLKIHHVGKTTNYLFYVMDPADDLRGEPAAPDSAYEPATLRRRIDQGPLPPEACLRLARQLLAGLASLHRAGMVHRDVKPSNCLFVHGTLKLADFGLVADADPHASRVGTQSYMPPNGPMDTRADVYAAGLVIYEMITGLPAERFPQLGPRARQVTGEAILSALNRASLQACQPDPDRRFRDAQQMLHALAAPAPARSRTRPLARWVAPGLAAVLVTALIGFSVARHRDAPTPSMSQGPGTTALVEVNFITRPFGATIQLDGKPLLDADGTPCQTPCTAMVPPGVHHTVFQHPDHPDWELGPVDYAVRREIEVVWPPKSPPAAGPVRIKPAKPASETPHAVKPQPHSRACPRRDVPLGATDLQDLDAIR